MPQAPKIILLPFSPKVFPRKYFKKGFALNRWPQFPLLKWILMAPFLVFIILTAIPVFLWLILSHYIYKEDNSNHILENYTHFLELFADMGFGNKIDWVLERDYQNPNKNEEIIKIVYLPRNKKSIFEKITKEDFYKYADEVWVFQKEQEIYNKLTNRLFNTVGSYWMKEDSNADACSFTYLNESDEKIKAILEAKKVKEYFQLQRQKQRHPQIQLKPNDILPPEVIYYYEPEFDPIINQYIQDNLNRIDNALNAKGYTFMYLPRILEAKNTTDTKQFAAYKIPNLQSQEIEAIVDEIQMKEQGQKALFKALFEEAVGLPKLDSACFIRCIEDEVLPEFKNYKYSVFPIIEEADESIEQKVNFYLQVVGKNGDGPQYRLALPDEHDPDEQFHRLGNQINDEIKTAVDNIRKTNDDKMLFSSMAYMINTLKDTHPDLCQKLNKTLYQSLSKNSNKISRLVIDAQYRIFLPDYNNLEIEMGPLPKTVFIFLLNHPEGVLFKALRPHVKELTSIYTKVGNRLDMAQIQKSINELTDPRSNSINEKCSRIKEAFISKIDDSIAQQYYVTGDRSSNKGIQIDRSLVQLPQTK